MTPTPIREDEMVDEQGLQKAVGRLHEIAGYTDVPLSDTNRRAIGLVIKYVFAQADRITALSSERDLLVERASALITKLDECEPHISNAASFMWAHGMEYSGPQYGEALEALRAALTGVTGG